MQALGSLSLEISDDLITWNSAQELTELLSQVNQGDGTQMTTLRMKQPTEGRSGPLFVRLRGQ